MPDSPLFEGLAGDLATLASQGLSRKRRSVEAREGLRYTLEGRSVLNFASNDYLGLADHPAIVEAAIDGARRWGVGAGASHLVSGHFAVHEELERRLAAFVGTADALLFSTGFMVNSGVIPALVGRGDAERFAPAEQIDPSYAASLQAALTAGVEALVYSLEVRTGGVRLGTSLPLML